MAYDRYDTRREGRGERPRWRDDDRMQQGHDDRGWFDRASDEVASWFGDEDAERRRRQDNRFPEGGGWSGHDRDRFGGHLRNEDDVRAYYGSGRERDFDRDRPSQRFRSQRDEDRSGWFGSERDYGDRANRGFGESRGFGRQQDRAFMSDEDFSSYERRPGFRDEGYRRPYTGRFAGRSDFGGDRDRDRQPYRPITGDYGRSPQFEDRMDRGATYYGAGSSLTGFHDRHYGELRRRHVDELDRDYEDYSREHQSQFENDFSGWRERRQAKRGLLGQVREHMEVLGSDGEHVGTVDRTAGDRLILAKSDEDSGGTHHSLMCTMIDRVEGNQVFLDTTAEEAKQRWRDESRERALFEREDQGEAGPGTLNRSFSGTY
jgi:hypothetical protein